MAKIDDLKTKANAVAGATQVGENTAARVGGALQDAASCIEELQKSLQSNNQSDADRDKIVGELKTSLISLQSALNQETKSRADADTAANNAISGIQSSIDTLMSGNVSEAIDNFNEIIAFLNGVKDEDTLSGLLSKMQDSITAISDSIGVEGGICPLNSDGVIDDGYIKEDYLDVIMVRYWDTESASIVGSYRYSSTSKKLEKLVDLDVDGDIKPTWVVQNIRDSVIYVDVPGKIPYIWNGNDMVQIAPKATPASIFNATTEVPISGYYTLKDDDNTTMSALHVAWMHGKAVSGLIMSFEKSAGIWKTYQYVGKSITEANWFNTDNWKDFGSLAAGSESYIIIDTLVGNPEVGKFYTLETAVAALLKYQEKTSVNYAKKGLIISYSTAENVMETKQFQGSVTDIGEVGLWKDFGGSSKVETKDEPAENGKDALSTGGAYNSIPANLHVDTDTGGIVKLQMMNAGGQGVGDEVQFAVGTGTGGSGGTIVSINYESSPLYTKSGSSVIIKAAIRSLTQQGKDEILNNIEKIELMDRDTNQTLETLTVNKASSADNNTFDFTFDVSSYFTLAGQRRFKMVAYDDAGNTGSRNLNVTAVDVTISSVQTLNYTSATSLQVGGASKSIPLYKFANNASDKGIEAITEVYVAGEWKELGRANVMDTYSHSVTIDPSNCVGQKLDHGALPIRVHGVDVGSGVVGNYLHTAVMVVEDGAVNPVVATRWYTDEVSGKKKLYETIMVDFACYAPTSNEPKVKMFVNDDECAERIAYRNQTYTFQKKVIDAKIDGTVTWNITAKSGDISSQAASFLISGTLIAIEEVKAQRQFSIEFASRSNNESDHTIEDNGIKMEVSGVNWSTNGFVKDNFGTDAEDGDMALRIAENASGILHYRPFADESIEQNGMAIQFTIQKKNIADDSTRLMSCIKNGFGFYVDGQNIVMTFDNGQTVAHTITAALNDAEKTNVAIVIEPSSTAPYPGIGVCKMFFDGDEIGACYYNAGSIIEHDMEILFDSSEGDLYVYNIKAWKTYYGFEQAFDNYLLTLTDTDAMITEYEFNNVMASQTAENTTKNRPQAASLYALGIPYFVLCKNADTADNDAKDNYPEYLEGLDGDKKTKRVLDVYAYFPNRPWQDFKVIGAKVTNQGTTSSKRPIKNIKMKLKGAKVILLHTEDEFTGEELEKFKECEKNAAACKVQIYDNSLPTNIITVKVDYSESGGANNGASTQLYNELQRGLGENYITPAQAAYNGTTKYVINTSICSIPCAFFRTDKYSPDATSPSYGYFHAKGNWNEDKGDAKVFGFEGVAGYNKDCLNYGDFIELVADKGESIEAFAKRVDKSTWKPQTDSETPTDNVYVLSEFCGPKHKVFRYKEGAWVETTGSMVYEGGKWVVTGDVVNPVENYELLKYDALDWFQGVNNVDDMLVTDTEGKPIWLQYFESRYPDDDNLNDLYEEGKKVPYYLYNWLKFCQDCNHHLTEKDGQITLGGVKVEGTKENRLKKWKQELHTVANIHSALCYHVFTDYIAAVDQRSKNMMVGFYLDKDGVERMYMNHLYDGDTILGSDNDCGLTIPVLVDPNNDMDGLYQGHDSVLFMQTAAMGNDGFWLDENGEQTITTAEVAKEMRGLTLQDGLKPFSYDGIIKYWVTDRLSKWPKLVSSFDGERKYINASKPTANYFYALHGLSIQRLKDFVKTRFLYRDGFYQTGDLFKSMMSMRCTGTNVQIKIRAAKDGYFGIGVDRANVSTDSCYLKAGESYTLKSGMTNTGSGTMLYVFGADRLDMIDISGCTPSPLSWDISQLTFVTELIIGGVNYMLANNNEGYLTNLTLGNLPFLQKLDIRNTAITNINAKYCPRLKQILADGSKLQRADIAEASILEKLSVPSTYKYLCLRYMPKIELAGISLQDIGSVETLIVEDCPKLDAWSLLTKIAGKNGSKLKYVRVTGIKKTGDGTDLTKLNTLGLKGIDSTLSVTDEPAISGRYQLSKYTEDDVLAGWRAAFKQLTIEQQAYSDYMEDDSEIDPQNITNIDNSTGYKFGNNYTPSGHILKIRSKSVPVKGKMTSSGKMHLEKISESNYAKYPDGSDFDNKDVLGERYDCFVYVPRFWYKGINDFKNQQKHTLLSSNINEPEATWTKKIEAKLSDILYKDIVGIPTANVTVGAAFDDNVLEGLNSCAVYRMNVEGMKQVRYIGMNNATYCSVFVGNNSKILQIDTLQIQGAGENPIDFKNENGDYIYRDVPSTAKWLYFTCMRGLSDDNCRVLAVDSSDIEAIEPGWELHQSELIGIYCGTLDDLKFMRSVSGRRTQRGNGTAVTSTEWVYDSEGNPTRMPVSAMNYTYQDLLNLCRYRGKGYHSVSYEQNKIVAILSRCWCGNRDDQRQYGFGCGADYTTGAKDSIGSNDTQTGNSGPNKIWKLEGWVGCCYEVMDNVAVNVSTFAAWKAKKRPDNDASMPTDGKWHIFDEVNKTERVVQGLKSSNYNIARLKHGRFCDIIASSVTNDASRYSTCYAAGQWYADSVGRCVGRASSVAYAGGGCVYAYAAFGSSGSFTSDGVRLAFNGGFDNESDIDGEIAESVEV